MATAAGVSTATVSRALSRPEKVGEATRARIAAAVDALGYRPHAAARGLAGDRWDAVAVVVPDITNPFFAAVVRSLQVALGERGAACLLADAGTAPGGQLAAITALADRVDAVVAISATAPVAALTAAADRRPVVLVNRLARGVPGVAVDQAAVVALALDHLAALGHRHVAVLPGPAGSWASDRRRRALADPPAGVRAEVVAVEATPGDDRADAALAAVAATGATAVVAFNDVGALALLGACRRAGVGVPEQLSVVGVDDVPWSDLVEPALTTVALPVDALARAAADRVLDPGLGSELLAPRLVVRRSSGCPGRPGGSGGSGGGGEGR